MRAVITGAGAVSPIGLGLQPFLDALEIGLVGVRPIESFDASTLPTRVAAEVPVGSIDARWVLESVLDVPETAIAQIERMYADGLLRDRKVGFALAAATEAWAAAGMDAREATLCLGLGLEQAFLEDFAPLLTPAGIDWRLGAEATLPAVRFRTPVDAAARAVRTVLGLTGPVIIHSSACASGTAAVSHAAALIERGEAAVVLAGASDSMINPLGLGGMARLGAPSPRNETDACRPFDRRRDGLVMGEGAAAFVVEAEDRARARGVTPLAVVSGWASTQDGYRVTAPRDDGRAAARAMERAIARAGLEPGDIGYVNAHGTGTPLNDPAEARAIRRALGEAGATTPVSSIKGAIGHAMAAAGALELAACLMAFERDLLPGTANHTERDPECDIRVIGSECAEARVDHVLSNSFGFGGQNASIVLSRPGAP